MRLPKDHWIREGGSYDKFAGVLPMFLKLPGFDSPSRKLVVDAIDYALKQAIRGAMGRGEIQDYDPDALLQSLWRGLFPAEF